MNRLLIVLSLLVCLLVGADYGLRWARRGDRELASVLKFLAPKVEPAQVGAFQLAYAGRSWTYVRRDSTWRFPSYFDAYVYGARADQFLSGLLQSVGSAVSAEVGDWQHYGLTPGKAMQVNLLDRSGIGLLTVWIGHGAPGPRAVEAYVRLAGSDTTYHLHANPFLALDPADPPMLDRRIVPRDLKRQTIRRINFNGAGPLQTLERVEQLSDSTDLMRRVTEGPSYVWLATFDGQKDSCLDQNAYAYTTFVSSLTYETLHDLRQSKVIGDPVGRLQLVDDAGRTDVLEIGARDNAGRVYVRLLTTGQIYTISKTKADLLLPNRVLLMNPLPDPTPYQQAQSVVSAQANRSKGRRLP